MRARDIHPIHREKARRDWLAAGRRAPAADNLGRREGDLYRFAWSEQDKQARETAEDQARKIGDGNAARRVTSRMPRRELAELAQRRADMMPARVTALVDACKGNRAALFDALAAELAELDAKPIKDEGQDLGGVFARLGCAVWWRRQLKRTAVRLREAEGRAAGEVCAKRRQSYVTTDTVRRLLDQDARNRATLEATELENAAGQVFNLGELADKSVSNPSIRRGELMTRINGCELWADAAGWGGMFTTQTTPSRFHATNHRGKANPKWEAAGRPSVADGQAWLCKTWARARSALQRRGLAVFGFRVAEPHQDGTPHWHSMLWVKPSTAEEFNAPGCKPGNVEKVAAVMRGYWLADEGDEDGAQLHRFKAVALEPGNAAGYCAKYIAKGIDNQGATLSEGHHDTDHTGEAVTVEQGALYHGESRVRFWARAHGIRQFQPIGQPPVTVWRELRRVAWEDVAFLGESVRAAWAAVQREGERKADWFAYMLAQRAWRDVPAVRVAAELRTVEGRYETATKPAPVGVLEVDTGRTARSNRQEWKPRGSWTDEQRAKARAFDWRAAGSPVPRSCVNNCTRAPSTEARQPAQPRAPWGAVRGVDRFAPWLTGAGGDQKSPPPPTK